MTAQHALVFDLDGTLIDSLPAVTAAINRVLADDGHDGFSAAEVRRSVGDGVFTMLEKLLGQRGLSTGEDAIEAFRRRYMDVYLRDPAADTLVYPGAREVLERYHRDGTVMGICTNKPRASSIAVLDALGFSDFFTAVVCAEDTPLRKPDGGHVSHTLERMGARRLPAVMIGDSETDIAAGKVAGLPTVLVSYGYCKVPLASLGATATIDGLSELPAVLTQIFEQVPVPS